MPRSGTQSKPRMIIPLFLFHYRAQSNSMISHRHILASCYSRSCAASADAARAIVRLKACSAGEAVIAETRPVEQTIYSPTEFRSHGLQLRVYLFNERRDSSRSQWRGLKKFL